MDKRYKCGVRKVFRPWDCHLCCDELIVDKERSMMDGEPDIMLDYIDYVDDEDGERWYGKCPHCGAVLRMTSEGIFRT